MFDFMEINQVLEFRSCWLKFQISCAMASKKSRYGLNEDQLVHLFSQKKVCFTCVKKKNQFFKSLDEIWIFKFPFSLISTFLECFLEFIRFEWFNEKCFESLQSCPFPRPVITSKNWTFICTALISARVTSIPRVTGIIKRSHLLHHVFGHSTTDGQRRQRRVASFSS